MDNAFKEIIMTTPADNRIQAAVPFMIRLEAAGMPNIAIRTFTYYYWQLNSGGTGLISEADIEPVSTLPNAEALPAELDAVGETALPHTVLLKLNGGLGTSMGLEKAKSLLPAKHGLSFLDIVARQALCRNVPLVLMNSFVTHVDSLAALERYPNLRKNNLPLDFVQHKVPKVAQADLTPVVWAANPALEWCPPGHGDIYPALVSSGMLDKLLAADYKYAFVSNADNLGAVLDARILGYFVQNNLPFMMEVADRTSADRKGGHLARRRSDGQLILRESAQCPPEDTASFQNVYRYKYFNTNNLWLNLLALKAAMEKHGEILPLPMIRNAKTVDPRDPTSTPVYQLETAMGSAIAVFNGAAALRVPRTRFAPVKTTSDLLAVRSDAYLLSDDFRVVLHPSRQSKPVVVELDPAHYKLITQLEEHFPHGAPSLLHCERFAVRGEVVFGADVVVRGNVTIENPTPQPMIIPDGAVLE